MIQVCDRFTETLRREVAEVDVNRDARALREGYESQLGAPIRTVPMLLEERRKEHLESFTATEEAKVQERKVPPKFVIGSESSDEDVIM